jgi:hypothetical protein
MKELLSVKLLSIICMKPFLTTIFALILISSFSQTSTVTLYDQCNYSGRRSTLAVGNHSVYQMQVRNDRLSSFKVPYGLKVTIYENDKFQGRSNTYTADQTCLDPEWRNMASSIVVERDPLVPANASPYDGVMFFNDCYSRGYSQLLRPGNYTGAQLGQLKYNISSFTINGNLRVRIFMNSENLAGASATYDNAINCLPGNQNDNIGSLIIEYKPSPTFPIPGGSGNNGGNNNNRPYATLYADCDFNGNALRLSAGTYSGEQLGLLKYDISSIELAPGLRAKVFINSQYPSGSSTTITSDMNCMSYTMNDRIGALVIEETGYGQQQYPDEKVILYTDANYKGQSVELSVGTWYNMEQAGFINDGLSSIKIPLGYKVILYDNPNKTGSSTTLSASRSDLSSGFGNWNDRVSSIVIYKE